MGKRSTNAKVKVFVTTLIVALIIAVAAFVAAQGNARATAESVQTDTVNTAVSRVQASNSSGYNAIVDILGRQSNASGERQWLLATNDTIVYARDVSTTSNYAGLPVESYSGGEDIERLLESATEGSVNHGTVTMNGEEYLGSATRFMLDGVQYSLCLLTAASALGGSTLTTPMMILYALLAVALVLLVAVPTFVASRLEKRTANAQSHEPAPVAAAAGEPTSATVAAAADAADAVNPESEPTAVPEPDVAPEPEPASVLEQLPEPEAALDPEPVLEPPFEPEPEQGPEVEPELASASVPEPQAEPEPDPTLAPEPESLPLRPRSELEGHLHELINAGIPGGNLVKISCHDEAAMNRVLLRLGPLAAGSNSHCYEFGDNSFIVELYEIDEHNARQAMAEFLLDDGEVTAFVSIDDDEHHA